jgi:hypothetical protein
VLVWVLVFKTKWGRGKIERWFGITFFEERMSELGQLSLARYEPEKWDIVIDVDRYKKSITFIETKPVTATDK